MNETNTSQPGSQPADGASSTFNFSRLLDALRCWWKIAVPVALLLATGVGAIIFYLEKPTYTADAWLLIKEKPDVILKPLDADSKRFIQNQMEIIRSPRLLGPLTQKPAILATPELKDENNAVVALGRKLQFKQRGQSDIFILSFTSVSPEKAELIVKEVTDAYLAFHSKNESEQDNRIIRLLEDQRKARFDEMNQLREDVRTQSVQLTGIDPFRAKTKETEVVKASGALATLQDEIVRQEVEQEYLGADIKAEEERQKEQKIEAPASEIEKQVLGNLNYLALVDKIGKNHQKDAEYQKTGKNLPNNPAYKQFQAELEANSQALEALKIRLRKEIKETMERQITLQNADRLTAMKQAYEANEARLKAYRGKLKQDIGTAKQYTGDSLDLEFSKAKLEGVTKIHDEIQARILSITTEQRAPDRVELFKEATRPVHRDELGPLKKVGLGAGLAFLVPFAAAVAWEQLFRRVTSRKQLETFHRLAVVAEITSLPSKQRGAKISNRSVNRDVLLFEESVDGLRTYLTLTESLRNLRVLAVTSASSKEGKTSLASQLAVSIARASGERVLLIDGDMRAPDIHAIFDTELSPGLAEVLQNKVPLEEAIETGFSGKLHILTAGRLQTSPHRLLGNGEFSVLLDKLCSIYRYIIVDTPPILPACESLVMARAADAAVFCIRQDYSRLDQVEEANRRMVAAGVTTAGAVLNGIPIKHYAFKYGSYAYSINAGSASA